MSTGTQKTLDLRVDCQGNLAILGSIDGVRFEGGAETLEYSGICLDSRRLHPGDVFFALKGDKDGHEYIEDAFAKGAVVAVVEKGHLEISGPHVQVPNALVAFQCLSKNHRMSWLGPVVALSGSNGKTTVKGFVSQLLQREFKVLSSPGNWNNHIGVPLTLLQLQNDHEYLILEMGMNHQGELARLVELAEPDILCLSNIGTAHIGELGSFENIVKAKAELFRSSKKNATLVVNEDQKEIRDIAKSLDREKVFFSSLNQNADTFCEVVEDQLRVKYGDQIFSKKWNIPGKHNVQNICAAIAICKALGVKPKLLEKALETVSLPAMRLEHMCFKGNFQLISDCYNANPDSMASALNHLIEFAGGSERKGAVLGDMKELGDFSQREHEKIGKLCVELGLDFLVTVGPEARKIYEAAISLGFSKENIQHHQDVESCKSYFKGFEFNNTTVLLKASRSVHLEKLLDQILLGVLNR